MEPPPMEMRLCWVSTVSHLDHEIRSANEWQPMQRADFSDLKIIMRVGNEIYGSNTHWIETRRAGLGDEAADSS